MDAKSDVDLVDATDEEFQSSIKRMRADLRAAAATLSTREARFLVDAYYNMQDDRIRAAHQQRQLAGNEEPHVIMSWLTNQRGLLEIEVRKALAIYADARPIGRWAQSISGIGPVITAGLIANIDIAQCPTVGHIWRYAGLDPTKEWLGKDKAADLVSRTLQDLNVTRVRGDIPQEAFLRICAASKTNPNRLRERLTDPDTGKPTLSRDAVIAAIAKRPWNASLKRLCFLIGESFVKVSNNPNDIYGKVYKARKVLEEQRNDDMAFAHQAAHALATKKFRRGTSTYEAYEAGLLPQARIHRRACRYAVKLFLSHFHHVWWEIETGSPPPKPYVLSHLAHADFLEPPNWTGAVKSESTNVKRRSSRRF